MFPKNMDFEFYLDSIKFVIIMFIVATIGMAYCAYLYVIREVSNFIDKTFNILYIIMVRLWHIIFKLIATAFNYIDNNNINTLIHMR